MTHRRFFLAIALVIQTVPFLMAQEGKEDASPKRPSVVVVSAHPDDLECGVSGTLLLLKDDFDIHLFVASRGERGLNSQGKKGPDPDGVHRVNRLTGVIREREARAAAELLGAKLTFFDQIDGEIFPNREACEVLATHLKEIRPAAVFTMWGQDVPDHAAAGHMALRALWDTKLIWGTDLFFIGAGPDQTRLFEADLLVPIASVAEQKWKVIRCHQCQNPDDVLVRVISKVNAAHGENIGASHAEAFKAWHPLDKMREKNRPVFARLVELGLKPAPGRQP